VRRLTPAGPIDDERPADQHEIDRQRRGDTEQQETGRAMQEQPRTKQKTITDVAPTASAPGVTRDGWIPNFRKNVR